MFQSIVNSKLLILSLFILVWINKSVFSSRGVFEIHIKKYTLLSSLNLTKCCSSSKNVSKSCPDQCNVFMEICLTVYQKNPHRYSCDIGETMIRTDILGKNTLNESGRRDYSILVRERWKSSFNILVKIKHKEETQKEAITIVTLSSSEENVKPGISWITKELSTPKDHFQLMVSFRFYCSKNYYGKECDKFCKPSADGRGYYNCSSNGDIICHKGYQGKYCDKVVCLKKCIHGTCVGPNQCRCLTGWTGESCNQCIPYPGCVHGGCRTDDKTKELLPLTCQCKQKWGGMFCNIDLNYCSNNPNVCENGGECQNFGNIKTNQQYRCICKPGFKGAHCEKFEANCLIRQCLNGGKCKNEKNHSECDCPKPFYGDRCQFNQTSCDDRPCMSSNSECLSDEKNGFRCKCATGFTGRNCEVDEDECSTKPCLNGGMCIDRSSGFLCVCPVGFSGDRCQVNKNDCQKLSCMNGAKCMDRANRIDCECTPGWTGKTCDQNINECAINQPCLNNGKCVDTPGSYKCICPFPWSGTLCDRKIIEQNKTTGEKKCLINPCRNNGICYLNTTLSTQNLEKNDYPKSIGGQYWCKCKPGFTGESCEQVIIANGSLILHTDYQTTTHPFVFPTASKNRPMTLILLTIIALGIPTIIVIIVSLLCCGRCQIFRKSKSDYQKSGKNENIIERTNIKILNNKLHKSQTGLYPSIKEKIPLSNTKMNNELSSSDKSITRYKCSHNLNISSFPLYNYQCHISPLSTKMFSKDNNYLGSQQYSNLFSPNTRLNNFDNGDDEKSFEKSSSDRDGEPESQIHKLHSSKSIDNEEFKDSSDLENFDKCNNKMPRGFNSAMLCRKSSNNILQDLCSSHNSLLDSPIKQNLRTAVSQQIHQPLVLPIFEDKDSDLSGNFLINSSRMSLNNTTNINLAWPASDYSFSQNLPNISNHSQTSSDNRTNVNHSRTMKNPKLNYNLISHPHFRETSCFFDSNLISPSVKSNKTDSTLIDDSLSTKM